MRRIKDEEIQIWIQAAGRSEMSDFHSRVKKKLSIYFIKSY